MYAQYTMTQWLYPLVKLDYNRDSNSLGCYAKSSMIFKVLEEIFKD